jgi:uncharacterized cupredoxin-like copper-binding protein
MIRLALTLAVTGATTIFTAPAAAHGEKSHAQTKIDYSKAEERPFGRASDPKKAKRTVRVDMSDTMRFSPAELEVGKGDTVRFIVRNSGKQRHEMVLGAMEDLKEHAALMRKHPGMEHDEPWIAHVAPGKTSELGWQFTQPGTYYYGCLIPGHFEAGMIGKVIVKP